MYVSSDLPLIRCQPQRVEWDTVYIVLQTNGLRRHHDFRRASLRQMMMLGTAAFITLRLLALAYPFLATDGNLFPRHLSKSVFP
ncbi:hypothetical protein BH688_13495 [Kushneria phosphatilytica]|nr:hypothetical protein BH688_13495 [Kushneria phosphatilytica]